MSASQTKINRPPLRCKKNRVWNGLKQLKMHFKHPFFFTKKRVWNRFEPPPLWKFPYFWGLPNLSSIFLVISWSILKICVPILVKISWIILNTSTFLYFVVFEWSYARNKENLHFRKLANLSHPKKSSFF